MKNFKKIQHMQNYYFGNVNLLKNQVKLKRLRYQHKNFKNMIEQIDA